MIQTPAIVTFANQKGGVGKTTLCVTFANYLYTMGVRVVVIDCDFQHSIYKCRDNDIDKYADVLQPYQVEAFSANDKDGMDELIEKLRNDPSIDVVLMDAPGNLTAGGLVPMFANSDIIVVPFHYDLVTVPSTASFIMFTERLRKATHGNMKAKLFVLPNQYDPRVGKRSELQLWQNTTNAFSQYAYVLSQIPIRADMQRFSTMVALDKQKPIVESAFNTIYAEIFDTREPIRKVELSGLQLAANLTKKRVKNVENTDKENNEDNGDNEKPETTEEIQPIPSDAEPDKKLEEEPKKVLEKESEAKTEETNTTQQ